MKTKTSYFLIATVILIVIASCAMWSFEPHTFFIDGNEIDGVAGVGVGILALAVGLLAVLFAAAVTGVVLVGVALFLALLAVVIVGSVGLALSPLLLPLLLLMGIIWLLNRPRKAQS